MNDAKRKLIPALATLGGTLAAGQAIALEIGPINVQSTLGEPLRASIAYALGPNEELAEYCVSLRRAVPGGAIPAISRATISIDKGLITITGATALREPLATVALDVSCPYTPKISREYMLMIDPGSRQTRTAEAAVQPPEPAASAAAVTAAAAPASRSDATSASSVNAGPPLEPLFAGDRLLVAPGHTLSLIVAAVGDREVDYAEAATRIVAANPEAFVDGDPDRLEAGSWLSIPDLRAAASAADYAPAPAAASVSPQRAAAEPAAPAATDEPETRAAQARSAVEAPSPAAEPAAPVSRDTAPPPAEVLTSTAPNAGLIDDTEFLEPAARPDTAGDGAADAVTAEHAF